MITVIVDVMLAIWVNMLTAFNILILTQLLFGVPLCRKRSHYPMLMGFFAVLNLICILLFPENTTIQFVLVYGYILLPIVILAKGRRIRAAFSTIPAILVYMQWAGLMEMFDMLLGLDRFAITANEKTLSPLYLLSDVFLFVIILFCLHQSYKKGIVIRLTFIESLILSLFCVFHPLLKDWLLVLENTFDNIFYPVVWVLFILVLNFTIFYAIIHRSYARHYKSVAENYKTQFQEEYAYFKDYKKTQQTVASFHHDWNNHMLLLQGMLSNGDYEKAKTYFHNLTSQSNVSQQKIFTGNEIVDILLNAKMDILQESKISVTCNGGLEALTFMEDVDICILFSNLIDNAIEANQKCDSNRFILIQAASNPEVLILTISNRMNGTVVKSQEALKSTKEDTFLHGIGTQNAFGIIKKYNGEYEIETKEDVFVIKIVFFKC